MITMSSSTFKGSLSSITSKTQRSWIEKTFDKRECVKFVGNTKDKNSRCGCGLPLSRHFTAVNTGGGTTTGSEGVSPSPTTAAGVAGVGGTSASVTKTNGPGSGGGSDSGYQEKWTVQNHTELSPTDAYGTIEFQGGSHPTKAQYVRIACDTKPELILQLLQKHWGLAVPKLLISVHGGIANFDLQPKLKRVFRKGLLKAAKTTGAWIVTGGTNTGVMRHVGNALGDTLLQARNNIVTIGIAPWGVVHHRHDLIGKDMVTPYHAVGCPTAYSVVLNSNHSYFLLVDNGTTGKYGGEIQLRKKLEKYISQQKMSTRIGTKSYSGTPVVCLIMEGGANTIRTVLECITDTPPVPVVVVDGSGRAADLLAFTHRYAQDDGTMPETLRDQLIHTIEKTFHFSRDQAEKHFIELMLCVKRKELEGGGLSREITVFRMSDGSQDIDLAILTALLKGQNASAPDQLSLALAWNREDIARNHIFVYGQEWPEGALDQAMMDALVNDRVDFVKLLLENGVSMHKWLNLNRLEELYNAVCAKYQDHSSTLRYLLKENKKHIPQGYRYTLLDIGLVLEQLMGGAYRAYYCRKKFRTMYNVVMKKQRDEYSPRKAHVHMMGHQISSIIAEVPVPVRNITFPEVFKYPFSELMVWAVMLKRQKMAKFMWQHGEEALAKALIACKLYKSMAREAAQDELDIDISVELRKYEKEFSDLALELLEHCYSTNEDLSKQLLTYELLNWSDQTALSLAVSACHRDFIANTCCQMLLTEMWMGALRMRKYTSLKVLLGIILPPSIVFLEFKSKEELQLMPQTMEEHIQEMQDSSSDDSSGDDTDDDTWPKGRRKSIHITTNSSNSGGHKEPPDYGNKIPNPTPNGSLLATPELNNIFPRKNSPLRLGRKLYEFYTAPITKFWAHTVGYIVFICLYTYIVLVRMNFYPRWEEIYVISYILTMGMEALREIAMSEPKKLTQKLVVFLSRIWNIGDSAAIIFFMIGLTLRFQYTLMPYGRVMFCVGLIYWYVRILDIFAVNKYLGPYVMMIGKMVKDMAYFIVILLVVLMSFGVTRQSIRYPMSDPSWALAKNIFLKPYFMIYGEVYAAEIDPVCGTADSIEDYDPEVNPPCSPGLWVVPAAMSIYLIVANILLINLLIAVFNNTFHMVNSISTQVWKFQRYSLVLEFESKPILPAPFILVCHIYLIIKCCIRRCRRKPDIYDTGLKLFLDEDEVERIHDFEEECVEHFFREKDQKFRNSTEERIRHTNEIVENMTLRMDDIYQKVNAMKISLQSVDHRCSTQEDILDTTTETLELMQYMVQSQLHGAAGGGAPSSGGSVPPHPHGISPPGAAVGGVYGISPGSATSSSGSLLSIDTASGHQGALPPLSAPVGMMVDSHPLLTERPPAAKPDRLGPFTDYKQRPTRRSYKRSMTLAGDSYTADTTQVPVILPSRTHNAYASNFATVGSVATAAPHATQQSISTRGAAGVPALSSELFYRRKNRPASRKHAGRSSIKKKPLPIHEESSSHNGEHPTRHGPMSQAARVRFNVASTNRSNTMPEESENKLEGAAMTSPRCSSVPQSPNLFASLQTSMFPRHDESNSAAQNTPHSVPPTATARQRMPHVGRASSQPVSVAHERSGLSHPRAAMMHVRTLTEGHEPLNMPIVPPAVARKRPSHLPKVTTPLTVTPIVTPSRSDYTTITDDIDTSGVRYGSSPGSPATPRHIYFGLDVNVDLYTKKESAGSSSGSGGSRGRPSRSDHLKHAEEAEHEQMELTIRKRIRQISLTESESLCNIARHAIDKLESSDSESQDDMYGYHSDEQEWLSQSTTGSDLHLLNKVNSEPTLDKLGFTMDTYMSSEMRNATASCSSASPEPANRNRISPAPSSQKSQENSGDKWPQEKERQTVC